MNEITCHFCNGDMRKNQLPKYNSLLTSTIIFLGVLFSISLAGIVLGAIMLIIGISMAFAKKDVWYCTSCKSVIERLHEKRKAA